LNPDDLRFAKTHEWVSVADEGGQRIATVGISAFAVEALTDLVYIELPHVGRKVAADESFCEVESVKAVSDIYAPVSGEVVAVNDSLQGNLEAMSKSPYGEGWIAKIKMTSPSEVDRLMDHATYQQQCAEEA
jgi:glycine cleavage system H protein